MFGVKSGIFEPEFFLNTTIFSPIVVLAMFDFDRVKWMSMYSIVAERDQLS